MCLSEDASPFVEKILPNYKYLQTLINKTPSACSQSEDVDLLLVSGEGAWHVQGETQSGLLGGGVAVVKWKDVRS